jgi:iodotyrosine deiodinase
MLMKSSMENKSENTVPLSFRVYDPEIMEKRSREYFEIMKRRRSVRHFSRQSVDEQIIINAVKTAASAPSGANKQPWHFCIVKDDALRAEMRTAIEAEEKENYERRFSEEMKKDISALETSFTKPHLTDAPYVIVVFKENFRVIDGIRRKNYYVNESVGIACGMLIAALHYAGLATLTHTPNPMKFLNQMLGRPSNETPVMVLPAGIPHPEARVPDISRKSPKEIMTLI